MGKTTPNFFLIYLAVFMSAVAFTMIFPLLPLYARHFAASNFTIGLLAASFALAQLFFSPLWGILSDRLGRKPVIVLGLLGLSVSFFVFALSASIVSLFVFRSLQGVFSAATMPSARAYIADLTSKKERVTAMGKIGAAIALGVILGPALGGLLSQNGFALPFLVAGALAALNLVFVFFLLPESLHKSKRVSQAIAGKVVFASFSHLWKGLQTSLAPLFILAFIWSFALSNNQVLVPLLGAEKFHLGADIVGFGFTIMAVVSATIQFFLLSRITDIAGQHKTVAAGLVLVGISFAAMPFLPPSVLFFYLAMTAAGIGSAVSRPVITALITEETQQPHGITLGTAGAFESTGRLLGPLLAGALAMFGTQVPFLASGAITMLVVLFVMRGTRFLKPGHAY